MGVKWKLVFPVYSSTKEEHIPAKTFESQMTESNMVGPESPLPEPLMDRDLAALKLQKTYKSFRTRRQLADCAILVEHRWLVNSYSIFCNGYKSLCIDYKLKSLIM